LYVKVIVIMRLKKSRKISKALSLSNYIFVRSLHQLFTFLSLEYGSHYWGGENDNINDKKQRSKIYDLIEVKTWDTNDHAKTAN
jgi:hypothetical protein